MKKYIKIYYYSLIILTIFNINYFSKDNNNNIHNKSNYKKNQPIIKKRIFNDQNINTIIINFQSSLIKKFIDTNKNKQFIINYLSDNSLRIPLIHQLNHMNHNKFHDFKTWIFHLFDKYSIEEIQNNYMVHGDSSEKDNGEKNIYQLKDKNGFIIENYYFQIVDYSDKYCKLYSIKILEKSLDDNLIYYQVLEIFYDTYDSRYYIEYLLENNIKMRICYNFVPDSPNNVNDLYLIEYFINKIPHEKDYIYKDHLLFYLFISELNHCRLKDNNDESLINNDEIINCDILLKQH